MTVRQRHLGSVVSLPAHSGLCPCCQAECLGTWKTAVLLKPQSGSLLHERGRGWQAKARSSSASSSLPPSWAMVECSRDQDMPLLAWAPREKGLKPQVLHGNEHCSLCRVGKLILSQGRVHLSREVRSSPPSPAPQPLPQALCQLCGMGAPAEAGWEPPGLLQQTGQCQSQHTVNHQPRRAARSFTWQELGAPGYTSFPNTGAFPGARAGAVQSPGCRAGLGATGQLKPWKILAWASWEPAKCFCGLGNSDPQPSPMCGMRFWSQHKFRKIYPMQ